MQYKNKSKIPRNITNPTITAGKASKNREIILQEVSNCQKNIRLFYNISLWEFPQFV